MKTVVYANCVYIHFIHPINSDALADTCAFDVSAKNFFLSEMQEKSFKKTIQSKIEHLKTIHDFQLSYM
jgi:hypothetical protein